MSKYVIFIDSFEEFFVALGILSMIKLIGWDREDKILPGFLHYFYIFESLFDRRLVFYICKRVRCDSGDSVRSVLKKPAL